jgi:PKD repeat protein
LSLNDPSGWSWDFGDGETSNAQHPTHTYVTTGTFAVGLTASNALDADTLIRPGYVIVLEPQVPEAGFSAEPTSGIAPLTVTFSDESTFGPTSWAWEFGDGGSSKEQHPQHTYYTPGTFAVTLTVSNTVGTDTLTLPSYITVREGERIYLPLVMRSAR